MNEKHLFFMQEALREARKAFVKGEVPVGAIAVSNDLIIAQAHNNTVKSKLFFDHAEFLVLKKINQKIKNYRLNDLVIYSTLEPCIMCFGALIQARVQKLFCGARNFNLGFTENFCSIFSQTKKFPKISIDIGLLEQESEYLLKQFFLNLRKKSKKVLLNSS